MNFFIDLIIGFFYGSLFSAILFGIMAVTTNFVDKIKYTHLDYESIYLSNKKKINRRK